MTPNAEEILSAKVVQIEKFQSTCVPHIGLWWTAKFQLSSKQKFDVLWNEKGYQFTPDSEHNQLPELEKINWKRHGRSFGNRSCGLDTEILLNKNSSQEDLDAYKEILTPSEIDEGHWVPYPSYQYIPMLRTAFKISHAYEQKIKVTQIVQKADHNLADVLALKKATYDLRQYC